MKFDDITTNVIW